MLAKDPGVRVVFAPRRRHPCFEGAERFGEELYLLVAEHGEVVGVGELSEAGAELVLRRAAELPPDVRLPDDAADLSELCGRVAMDLAFVGRWSTVRGRRDRRAWSKAARKVRAEMKKGRRRP